MTSVCRPAKCSLTFSKAERLETGAIALFFKGLITSHNMYYVKLIISFSTGMPIVNWLQGNWLAGMCITCEIEAVNNLLCISRLLPPIVDFIIAIMRYIKKCLKLRDFPDHYHFSL